MVERFFDGREEAVCDQGAEAADATREAFLDGDVVTAREGVYAQMRALDALQKLGFERRRAGQLIESLHLPFLFDTNDEAVVESREENKHIPLERLKQQASEVDESETRRQEYFSRTTLFDHMGSIRVFHYRNEEEPSIETREIIIPRNLQNEGRGRSEIGTRQEQILYGLYELDNNHSQFMYPDLRDVCITAYSDVMDKSSRMSQAANALSNIYRVYLKLEDAFDPHNERVQFHMATFLKSLSEHPLYGAMTLQDVIRVAKREISFDEITERYGTLERGSQDLSSGATDVPIDSANDEGLLTDQEGFVRFDDIEASEGEDGVNGESYGFLMGEDFENNEFDEDELGEIAFSFRSDDIYFLSTILSEDAGITDRLDLRLSENDVIKLTSIVESFDNFEEIAERMEREDVEERIGAFISLFAMYAETQNEKELDGMIDCLEENRQGDARFVFSLLRRGVRDYEDASSFLKNVSEIFY